MFPSVFVCLFFLFRKVLSHPVENKCQYYCAFVLASRQACDMMKDAYPQDSSKIMQVRHIALNWSKTTLISHDFSRVTDIQGRSQTSCTALCNGVVSHEAQNWESSGFCQPHPQNQMQNNSSMIFVHRPLRLQKMQVT